MKIRSSKMRELLILILSLVAATTAESFADWMTKDFCDRKLVVGEVPLYLLFLAFTKGLDDFY